MADRSDSIGNVGPLADLLSIHLRRVDMLLSDLFYRQYEKYDRSEFFSSLAVIASNPGLAQSEVAKIVRRDTSTLVGIINFLESQGWVLRKLSTTDRRKHELYATELGHEVLNNTAAEIKSAEEELLADVTPEELAFLRFLLEKVHTSCVSAIQRSAESTPGLIRTVAG